MGMKIFWFYTGLFVPMNRVSKAPPTHLAIERRRKSANGDRGGRKRESIALSPRTFEAAQGAMSFNTDLQVCVCVCV